MRTATWAVLLAAALWPRSAHADLVTLSTGRTLSVMSFSVADGRATLRLRGGGEIVCDEALVVRVEPDEVPWPAPADAPADSAVLAPAVRAPYDEVIEPLARAAGVEAALVRAVIATESAFERTARSPKGAMGLMQLMPDTARQYAVSDPYDPVTNIAAGIRHLKSLLDRYDIREALAAYNAGEANVRRHGGVPPFRETRDYVERVLRRLKEYRRLPAASAGPADATRPALALPTS